MIEDANRLHRSPALRKNRWIGISIALWRAGAVPGALRSGSEAPPKLALVLDDLNQDARRALWMNPGKLIVWLAN